ncbi:hypothetical protein ACIA5G_39635 [Amycolatopsis sp. NPDC051758]
MKQILARGTQPEIQLGGEHRGLLGLARGVVCTELDRSLLTAPPATW